MTQSEAQPHMPTGFMPQVTRWTASDPASTGSSGRARMLSSPGQARLPSCRSHLQASTAPMGGVLSLAAGLGSVYSPSSWNPEAAPGCAMLLASILWKTYTFRSTWRPMTSSLRFRMAVKNLAASAFQASYGPFSCWFESAQCAIIAFSQCCPGLGSKHEALQPDVPREEICEFLQKTVRAWPWYEDSLFMIYATYTDL